MWKPIVRGLVGRGWPRDRGRLLGVWPCIVFYLPRLSFLSHLSLSLSLCTSTPYPAPLASDARVSMILAWPVSIPLG
jgi:hypothetical protein